MLNIFRILSGTYFELSSLVAESARSVAEKKRAKANFAVALFVTLKPDESTRLRFWPLRHVEQLYVKA
jgi:hypothetical protein